MSRLNNEGVRKAAGGILANLTEAENLKVNKVVLTNGKEAIRTDVLTESVKPAQPEGAEQPIKEELEEPVEGIESEEVEENPDERLAKATELLAKVFGVESTDEERETARAELTSLIAGEGEPSEEPEETEELPEEPEEIEEGCKKEAKEVCPKCKKENCVCKESEEVEPEDRMVEGLEILEEVEGKFLLKESAGFIVGKNYNKETGIIEEAEEYRTEKIARKAFDRLK